MERDSRSSSVQVTDVIPKLYQTDKIPFEKKVIHQKWDLKQVNFCWLIAELDRKENLAFGYANLNDDMCAEWGYISIQELMDNGAELDRSWQPCAFEEAQKRIKES
jgi:hypothetical protein